MKFLLLLGLIGLLSCDAPPDPEEHMSDEQYRQALDKRDQDFYEFASHPARYYAAVMHEKDGNKDSSIGGYIGLLKSMDADRNKYRDVGLSLCRRKDMEFLRTKGHADTVHWLHTEMNKNHKIIEKTISMN